MPSSRYKRKRMNTLFDPNVRSSVEGRLRSLAPDSRRRWGRMTPHEAICHLSDGFRAALRQKTLAPVPGRLKPVMRFIALTLPVHWPRGIKTFPEVEQGVGGTPPAEFERDRHELLSLIARFCAARPDELAPEHPMFARMTRAHWGRWAYRHLDHHLRQFGA